MGAFRQKNRGSGFTVFPGFTDFPVLPRFPVFARQIFHSDPYAPVAQLDRVSDSDSEGRAFESHQAYQDNAVPLCIGFSVIFFFLYKSVINSLAEECAAQSYSGKYSAMRLTCRRSRQ